jgi:unsaturated chondroitin disaccharide hydrolase
MAARCFFHVTLNGGRKSNPLIQFDNTSDESRYRSAVSHAQAQTRKLIETQPDYYPMYTQEGRWKHDGEAWTDWCDGFTPGIMWALVKILRGAKAPTAEVDYWMKQAIRYTKPVEARKSDPETQDHGFLFFSTYYRWYALTGDVKLKEVMIEAGRTLANRYQEKGQHISSFAGANSLFIDSMMNIGTVFYAARETGDRRLRDVAMRHALTARRVLVRGDGSTAHEGLFDPATGEFLRQSTQQGWRGDSCWSRGLTWGIYGFCVCYEYSRDPRFLSTAEALADYYITNANSDGMPPWDFRAPSDQRKLIDTSAAAIAACGLLRLARLLADPVKDHFYWSAAMRILHTLTTQHLTPTDGTQEGILRGGIYHLNRDLGVNESVIWGDYFYVEALERVLRPR